ncbi:bifunctional D-glycero-beta-D-manno-heptose-7-phosphate kinase/D-glycero-beta-D-manno-heptose 1-phosphate adenylyltransferase HldE [Marinospirillum insulare]|uniref:Bifunctional protein HldE n=1 Tax=Marinospirillum insulare TaxID=217169 RepID=A0ABQ6A0R0_9GAMM|nr:bifunctional D-glycero-beta-D-manno-heptose-7-phosphate kinase/D-glycero-beta-D-manno-heptose 1-phosphate adenylyltransferase HldE [Marinospirillum insulare]GLR64860.1 bifunctional protein HldE [Marinospirillum insulare]
MKVNFAAFEQANILVAGDVMLDRYWQGATSRISPEAPVPVVKVQAQDDRPGGAANVALNLVSLGANAGLAGIVGRDDNARLLDGRLEQLGVKTFFDRSDTQPTVTKVRVMSRNQQLIRLDFEEQLQAGQSFLDAFSAGLKETDLVILSDYAKGTLNQVQKMIQMARKAGKRVLIDPKGQDFSIYRQASVLTPNLSEFEAIVGECKDETELEQKGEQLRSELELEALLITRSEKGMTLIREGLAPLHLPTRAQEIYDVTGAGDTVIAVLGLALASGHDFPEAMMLANLAAGVVVAKPGTATVSLGEIYTALHSDTLQEYGVTEADRLAKLIRLAKNKGEKIVFTNGCFDLLHAGHVAYLEEARKLGNRLVVAVNSDESVSRLKGPSRPINTLERRMRVLAGLQSVDWVVPFTGDTPAEIIAQLVPNVLVKGGDYQVEAIAGAATVLAAGGEVKVLSFVDGVSTTAMVRSILDKS